MNEVMSEMTEIINFLPPQQRLEMHLRKLLKEHKLAPYVVQWFATRECNFACKHCGSDSRDARASELTTEEALIMVEKLAKLGTRWLAATGGEVRIPIVVKEIPQMSVHLGMLTQEEFVILKICDGMNTIEQVAEIAQKPVDDIESMMEKLRKKGLVKVIKREV